MLGMLQILTYLLCVYLVFKGFEIFIIATSSPKEDNRSSVVMATILLLVSIIAAVGFALWATTFAYNVSIPMQGL